MLHPIDRLIDKCLDQTAGPAERLELERRLSDPDDLTVYVAAQRLNAWLEALLKEAAQIEPARALAQSIEERGQRRKGGQRRFLRTGRLGFAAALLLAAGVAFWRTSTPFPPALPVTTASIPSPDRPPDEMSPVEVMAVFGLVSARAVK